jgi:hypothetical protein
MKAIDIILIILFASLIEYLLVYYLLKIRKQKVKVQEDEKTLSYLQQLATLERINKEACNEKEMLKSEINEKNKELAAAVMHLIQKTELIGKLKDELVTTIKNAEEGKPVRQLKKILKLINEDHKAEDDWDYFAIHFDSIHEEFLQRVRSIFPGITRSELKLCSYIKMNLSTKEMAPLMNISVRGVEVSRYRLRKKLQIPPEMDIYTFLMQRIDEKEFVA